ncbi:uncharacterized protein LOC101895888 isoform X2 [Musca domestica]|uniref:MFS transporter n=1 Tax=Musca domestica TaxID=7370 RepID=A0A1I8MJ97_MUSDO|nr:uncharacterized protein LOC101895888 isoform X2 [Musca domestica]
MANNYAAEDNLVEQLKSSVKAIMDKTGSSKFAHDLMERIHSLQQRLETLSNTEKTQFIEEMRDTFRATIETVENKLMQHAHFEKVYTYSIYAAIIFSILFVFALFGYKLYKSLMSKELKKQEKLKQKQSKKSKKVN